MPYLPIMDKFIRGDIILVRSDAKPSKLIRLATGGEFSHVLICVDPPTLIEAVPGDTRNLTLGRLYIKDIENIRVLRYFDPDIAAKAGREASLWLDTPYSYLAALYSIPIMPKRGFDKGIFCSRLVAEAFREAGGSLLPQTRLTQKVTPALIAKAESLTDVTDSLFEDAPENYNLATLSALDVKVSAWKLDALSRKRRKCAEDMLPTIQRVSKKYPRQQRIIPSFMRIIEWIVKQAECQDIDESRREDLTSVDEAFYRAITDNDLIEEYKNLIENQDKYAKELLNDFLSANPKFDIESLKQNLGLSARYDRREQSAIRLNQIAVQSKLRGLKAYSNMEKDVVRCLRRLDRDMKIAIDRRQRL